ncbi:NCS2 family permease [Streptococcus gordonii]|uniref:Xanthine/uracil permease n=1 Tax=Streptococcus gordonii TaxID=1302 RepID=A0AB34SAI0_STRGN|nr:MULTISPECIES: NCS2 family permease [Streptococcus]ALD70997.1 guanine permease [Streptococcus gordonii]AOS70987.1 guanine permease [Streptococcus gordonii]ARC46145.1 NCS2 family permease [Streptococcus gordonii]ATF64043.1 NCS2 family permease [Streptococcus gordonii]KJQ65663.1 xanthine/uracil permease [Streptococcus gordonii]
MDKLFKLKENGTTVRTEILAGLTTFFAMSYILFVNPAMLSQTGMPAQGVFLATIIGAVAGTLMMAFYANLPYAQAPGMGLNAFFTFTVVFSLGYTWQEALGMVFICGIISLIITLTKIRKTIIESIPGSLRAAISAGIGVFLAYVGIKNAGLLKFSIDPGTYTVAGESVEKAQSAITANSSATPGLVAFNDPAVLVALVGLAITVFFVVKGIKGGVILSIFATTVVAISVGLVNLSLIDLSQNNLGTAFKELGEIFGVAIGPKGLGALFTDTARLPQTFMAILAFSLTDIFDTIGTLIGTGEKVGIVASSGENHESERLDKALYSDLIGTSIGAIAGTSNVTTYVESAAGIGAGGRTGLTALVVAICFAISSFFSPLLAIVPTVATAPILIVVGIMMLGSLKNIEWDDLTEAIPAFFTSIFMGFSYSITHGIAAGFIMYALVKTVKGQAKEVHTMIWILDALFILNFVSLALAK